MTEGIIQETFKKHLKELCNSEYFDEVMMSNYQTLQRELIEKIKQLELHNQIHDRWYLEKIIGDNNNGL